MEENLKLVEALYDHEPDNDDELLFYQNDRLYVVQDMQDGWVLGYLEQDPDQEGLFPANYVQEVVSEEQEQDENASVSERQTQSRASSVAETQADAYDRPDTSGTSEIEERDQQEISRRRSSVDRIRKDSTFDLGEISDQDTARRIEHFGDEMDEDEIENCAESKEREEKYVDEKENKQQDEFISRKASDSDEKNTPGTPEMNTLIAEAKQASKRDLRAKTSVKSLREQLSEAESAKKAAENARKKAEEEMRKRRASRRKSDRQTEEDDSIECEKVGETEPLEEDNKHESLLEDVAVENDEEISLKGDTELPSGDPPASEAKDEILEIENENRDEMDRRNAAICIQRYARGYIHRKKMPTQQRRDSIDSVEDIQETELFTPRSDFTDASSTNIDNTIGSSPGTEAQETEERAPVASSPRQITPELMNLVSDLVEKQIHAAFEKQDEELREMRSSLSSLVDVIAHQTAELHKLNLSRQSQNPGVAEDGENYDLNLEPSSGARKLYFPPLHKATSQIKPPKKYARPPKPSNARMPVLSPTGAQSPNQRRPHKYVSTVHSQAKLSLARNIVDDNGMRYAQCKSMVYAPTDFAPSIHRLDPPESELVLDYVHGYNGSISRREGVPRACNILFSQATDEMIFPASAVVILYSLQHKHQAFYLGHDACVQSLCFHPNQKVVASGQASSHIGVKAKVHIWDLTCRKENSKCIDPSGVQAILRTKTDGGIIAVAFSSNGEILAALNADDYHTISVWDWKAKAMVASARSHSFSVVDLHFHPSLVCSEDNRILNYGMVTCGVKHIKFWQLKQPLASSSSKTDAQAISWQVISKEGLYPAASNPPDEFTCVHFVPKNPASEGLIVVDGLWVAGTSSGHIYLWHQKFGLSSLHAAPIEVRLISIISNAHNSSIMSLAFENSTQQVATCSHGGVVKFWATTSFFNQETTPSARDINTTRLVIPNGPRCLVYQARDQLIVGFQSNQISLLEIAGTTTTVAPLFTCHRARIEALASHPSKPWYASICREKHIYLWDSQAASCLIGYSNLHHRVHSCAFDPSGELLACVLYSNELIVFRIDLNKQKDKDTQWKIQHQGKLEAGDMVMSPKKCQWNVIKYSPSGRYLALSWNDRLVLYDATKNYQRHALCRGHTSSILHLDWSCDSTMIQADDTSNEILVWEAATGKQMVYTKKLRDEKWSTWTCVHGWSVQGLYSGKTKVCCVHRANGAKLLVAGDENKRLSLYRYPCLPGAEGVSVQHHSSAIKHVEFVSDDSKVISIESKMPVLLQWKCINKDAKHSKEILPQVDPDGHRIYS